MAKFNKEDFFSAVKETAKEYLLSEKETNEILENAFKKQFYSKFDPDAELEVNIDSKNHVLEFINNSKYVVENSESSDYRMVEIPLEEAKKIKEDVKVGEIVSEKIDLDNYKPSQVGQVMQLFKQSLREKRKEAIYAKHKGLKGEMVIATVVSLGRTHAVLKLEDGTVAFMPPKFRNLNIHLGNGEKTKVFVEDVLEESKDAQIIVSNGSKEVVKRVLEEEVPELMDGTVELVSLSRLPGERTKVAVRTTNDNVDAVGAIIGSGGSRIKTIIEKLEGEKLDIIAYSDDIDRFVINAISPAKVIAILDKKDENGKSIEGHKIIITPNKHQTLAIGRKGSNARLAVELTKNRIDILSIDEANEKGLVFEWNGNVNEDQLESIEAGIRIARRNNNTRPQRPQNNFTSSFDHTQDDLEISTFNEGMEFSDDKEETYDIESDFSEADLEKMQADFEFDNELADIDLDDVDFSDGEDEEETEEN